MENFKEYWNNNYEKRNYDKIVYDNWLDQFNDELISCKTKILDLGCGVGNDTLYLLERGQKVLSCDQSEVALNILSQKINGAETMQIDISQKLPFDDNSFDIIIADLCLHYFDDKTTKSIMHELRRILSNSGYLFARVNSTKDKNHGAGQGIKLEENFYYVEGYNKRFFTIDDAKKYFSIIGETSVNESQMLRYEKLKECLVIKVQKNG